MGSSGFGGKGTSESASSVSTTSANYDQRVAAEAEGIALGQGAAIVNVNEFGDNIAKAYLDLVNFAKGSLDSINEAQAKSMALGERAVDAAVETGQGALDYINKSNESALDAIVNIGARAAEIVKQALEAVKTQSQTALTTVAENQQEQNPASTSIYKDLFPWVAIAAVVLVALFIFRKGK